MGKIMEEEWEEVEYGNDDYSKGYKKKGKREKYFEIDLKEICKEIRDSMKVGDNCSRVEGERDASGKRIISSKLSELVTPNFIASLEECWTTVHSSGKRILTPFAVKKGNERMFKNIGFLKTWT